MGFLSSCPWNHDARIEHDARWQRPSIAASVQRQPCLARQAPNFIDSCVILLDLEIHEIHCKFMVNSWQIHGRKNVGLYCILRIKREIHGKFMVVQFIVNSWTDFGCVL